MMEIKGAKGGDASPHVPVESPDSLHSIAKAKVLLCLGHGMFAGTPTDETIFLNGTPIKGADGSTNFTGVRWVFRPGTQTQDPITEFPAVETETAIGTVCKAGVPVSRALSNRQLTACRVRLGFPRMAKILDNGDTVGTAVQYTIDVSTDGGAFVRMVDGVCTGKTTTLYQRQHRINLPKSNTSGWIVRVTRTTPDSTVQTLVDAFNFEVLTEVIDVKLRYPNLALLYLEFDAEQFPQGIPQVTVKIKGQECWVPDNYDPISRTYTGIWNGTLVRAWTDNPAWHVFEAISSKAWGLGNRISSEMIDKSKWELYRVAQFADQQVPDGSGVAGRMEPRFISNVYFQAQNSAFNVLRDLVAIFNGYTYWAGDHLAIGADMPRDPVRAVNNTGVQNGRFEYSFGDQRNRHSSAVVQYDDPTNHYATTPKPVQLLELVSRYGVNPMEVTAIGCTRDSEAQRRGLYMLYTNMDDMMCSFTVGLDGMVYRAGNVINVADSFLSGRPDIAGRVAVGMRAEAGGFAVTLDRAPTDITGRRIYFNDANGIMRPYQVSTITDRVVRVIKVADGPTPAADSVLSDASWVAETASVKPQQFQVMAVVDNGDNTFTVSCVKYNPGKQAAVDTGARLDQLPVTDIPPGWLAMPANPRITATDRVVQGLRDQTMRIDWDAVDGATSYVVQWRRDNNDWVNAGQPTTQGIEVPDIYTGLYTARVRAVNAWGVSSPWAVSPSVALTGRVGTPSALAALTTTPLIGAVRITWGFDAATGADTAYTEIRFRPNGTAEDNPLFNMPYPATGFDHTGLVPAAYFQYRARIVDKIGNVSPWTAWVVGNSAEDIGAYIEGITDDFLNSEAGKALGEKIDFTGAAILAEALANRADIQQRYVVDGKNKAQILRIDTVVSDQQRTLAEQQTLITAQRGDIDNVAAAVDQKMTAVVDHTGTASATYSIKAGINYQGQYVAAGMVIGAEVNGGVAKSTIGFNGGRFIIVNDNNGVISSPFVIDAGNTYINTAMIKAATINFAQISDTIQSTNWDASNNGWRIAKDGSAWFYNVTVRGRVEADYGYFAAELRATSGYLRNVTIEETCTVKRVVAENIVGDIFRKLRFTLPAKPVDINTVLPGGASVNIFVASIAASPYPQRVYINGLSATIKGWGQNYTSATLVVNLNGADTTIFTQIVPDGNQNNFTLAGAWDGVIPANTAGNIVVRVTATRNWSYGRLVESLCEIEVYKSETSAIAISVN